MTNGYPLKVIGYTPGSVPQSMKYALITDSFQATASLFSVWSQMFPDQYKPREQLR